MVVDRNENSDRSMQLLCTILIKEFDEGALPWGPRRHPPDYTMYVVIVEPQRILIDSEKIVSNPP